MSLAEKNNNPGNIRYNRSIKWKGQLGENRGFCVFENLDYGLRAMILLLKRYINVYKLTSVEKIISRYAPAFENNTCGYISFVSDDLLSFGILSSDIEYKSIAFYRLVSAMVRVESGKYLYSIDDIVRVVKHFNL